MTRYALEFCYDGSTFLGWQRQVTGSTVQSVVEGCLSKILGIPISVVGAGRTDTGVHAYQMFAHFDCSLPPLDLDKIKKSLNGFLPHSISIKKVLIVSDNFHARFSALSRTYLYRITSIKNPFEYRRAMFLNQPLDIALMNEASSILLKHEDFECFSKKHSSAKHFLCCITHAKWTSIDEGILNFEITANRFLRNMVRAVVGTILKIGMGTWPVRRLNTILLSKDRSESGPSAPAHGLYLKSISYSKDLFL